MGLHAYQYICGNGWSLNETRGGIECDSIIIERDSPHPLCKICIVCETAIKLASYNFCICFSGGR